MISRPVTCSARTRTQNSGSSAPGPRPHAETLEARDVVVVVDRLGDAGHQHAPAETGLGVEVVELDRDEPGLLGVLQLRAPRGAEDHVLAVDPVVDGKDDQLALVDERQPGDVRPADALEALAEAEDGQAAVVGGCAVGIHDVASSTLPPDAGPRRPVTAR